MVAISKSRIKARKTAQQIELEENAKKAGAVFGGIVVGYMLLSWLFSSGSGAQAEQKHVRLKQGLGVEEKIQLNFDSELSASYKAVAFDILDFLKCEQLLSSVGEDEEELEEPPRTRRRRRLQENKNDDNDDDKVVRREPDNNGGGEWGDGAIADDPMAAQGEQGEMYDDEFMGGIDFADYSAAHLFCLAAVGAMDEGHNGNNYQKYKADYWKEKIQCDAANTRQQTLLDLWSEGRANIPETIFNRTLQVAHETQQKLFNEFDVNLWAPEGDNGLDYVLGVLNNEEQNADHGMGSIRGLTKNLGKGHLFVDVGSCLGITTLGVALQYPKTRIVSIEPAAPNWLMQQMNLRCNLPESVIESERFMPSVLLAGIGPQKSALSTEKQQGKKHQHQQHEMMAKFMWRPSATTATRAWTPQEEKESTDQELIVKLKNFYSLLQEVGIQRSQHIDVLNIDCEGCEYNLIPSLSDDEYESIDTVMGGVHWGYIPKHKLPSSQRAKETHERLCVHENFARTSKECCAFPEMAVTSSVPGEVLLRSTSKDDAADKEAEENVKQNSATVLDVAGSLCDNFEEWSENNLLFNVDNDFGWFQLTSMAN